MSLAVSASVYEPIIQRPFTSPFILIGAAEILPAPPSSLSRIVGESLFTMIEVRTANAALLEGGSRFEIWNHAFNAFAKTLGLGSGIGGIKAAMAAEWNGINIPHNIFLEVLLEFGLIIFICFISFLYKIIHYARKYADDAEKITIYLALFSFPVYGIIDSGYLKSPFVFAAISSWLVFACFNQIKYQKKL